MGAAYVASKTTADNGWQKVTVRFSVETEGETTLALHGLNTSEQVAFAPGLLAAQVLV